MFVVQKLGYTALAGELLWCGKRCKKLKDFAGQIAFYAPAGPEVPGIFLANYADSTSMLPSSSS